MGFEIGRDEVRESDLGRFEEAGRPVSFVVEVVLVLLEEVTQFTLGRILYEFGEFLDGNGDSREGLPHMELLERPPQLLGRLLSDATAVSTSRELGHRRMSFRGGRDQLGDHLHFQLFPHAVEQFSFGQPGLTQSRPVVRRTQLSLSGFGEELIDRIILEGDTHAPSFSLQESERDHRAVIDRAEPWHTAFIGRCLTHCCQKVVHLEPFGPERIEVRSRVTADIGLDDDRRSRGSHGDKGDQGADH